MNRRAAERLRADLSHSEAKTRVIRALALILAPERITARLRLVPRAAEPPNR